MIEALMFASIGFLAASLLALAIVPPIHNRAQRLLMRRIEASVPLSVAEIRADKDCLRAEFAMSIRRLELIIDELKAKNASQSVELGRKTAEINQLKATLDAKMATMSAFKKRQILPFRKAEEEFPVKANPLRDAEFALAEKEAEITRLKEELRERSSTENSQRVEMVALRIQNDTLRDQITDLRKIGP